MICQTTLNPFLDCISCTMPIIFFLTGNIPIMLLFSCVLCVCVMCFHDHLYFRVCMIHANIPCILASLSGSTIKNYLPLRSYNQAVRQQHEQGVSFLCQVAHIADILLVGLCLLYERVQGWVEEVQSPVRRHHEECQIKCIQRTNH